ncbi:MAG: hypothetical protein SWO11_22680 [Thermodesulfobacteriota bacterium]|nr:hypothetical protein [Thermodesulfobacteriota bacterium]
MKKIITVLGCFALILFFSTQLMAGKNNRNRDNDGANMAGNIFYECAKIQDGTILRSDGKPVVIGFDEWGYNYQAHLFNGYYCDAYRDAVLCKDYKDIKLSMKWNDLWLSNKDCDDDGLLDRHYGFDSYIGSGAWLTYHEKGTYNDDDSTECKYEAFVKIVAAPADAEVVDGVWYSMDGTEIGDVIWGQFAIIQEVESDHCAKLHRLQYISPIGPGFGKFKP